MELPSLDLREYVRRVLQAYRATPGTAGVVRRADRLLALQLHERGVPLDAVENAMVLAAARRILRSAEARPLEKVRSLAYFVPVIEEVLQLKVSQEYFQHLRDRLHALLRRDRNSPERNPLKSRGAPSARMISNWALKDDIELGS